MELEYMQFLASNISKLPKDWVQPTPIDDIERVEQTLGIIIPKALKEFFLLAGNAYGPLLYDVIPSNPCVQNLVHYQEEAARYFIELGQQPLTNSLVFAILPEYLHFVKLDGEDNPYVYQWEYDFFSGIIEEHDFPFTPEDGPGMKRTLRFREYLNHQIEWWINTFEAQDQRISQKAIVVLNLR
jgi:hypothetical protein